MKKLIGGVLMALSATYLLTACEYEQKKYTHDPNCTCTCDCCVAARGESKDIDTDELIDLLGLDKFSDYSSNNSINVVAPNGGTGSELRNYIAALYDVEASEGDTDFLRNGLRINWIDKTDVFTRVVERSHLENDYVLQSYELVNFYNEVIDKKLVDICTYEESEYLYGVIDNKNLIDLGKEGLNFSNQFNFMKNAGKNSKGKQVGSGWAVAPSFFSYNEQIAKDIYGNDVSYEFMSNKIKNLVTLGGDAKNHGYNAFIGLDSFLIPYQWNSTLELDGNKFYIDNELFDYYMEAKTFYENNYITSSNESYYTWGIEWGKVYPTTLLTYSCSWFPKWCLEDYTRVLDLDETPQFKAVGLDEKYASCWGGQLMFATSRIKESLDKKNFVIDFISKTTTDYNTMLNVNPNRLCPNNTLAVDALANDEVPFDESYVFPKYFGGQNIYKACKKTLDNIDNHQPKSWMFWALSDELIQAYFNRIIINEGRADEIVGSFINKAKTNYNIDILYDEDYVVIGDTIEYK